MFPEFVKYYYDKLPDIKKSIYMQMYKGLRAHKTRIAINTNPNLISPEDLMYIFRCLYNDTPSFYFVDLSQCKLLRTETGYIFEKDFIYSEKQIEKFDKEVINGLIKFKKKYIKDGMSDYEKEIVIHDYLTKTVVYDSESVNDEEQRIRHGEIYNILGPLLRKKAVCWGIACAFKLLCDYCQIKCFVIIGKSFPVVEDSSGHAWNIVRINDENYHVDTTWDIKKKGDISFIYEYLNLNDNLIKLDHIWDDRIYPKCSSLKHNYYKKNHLYVKTKEEISQFVSYRTKKGFTYITFKFVSNDMPSKKEIVERIKIGLRSARYYDSFSWAINENTHNIYIELNM